jgi:hypothetical protein
LVLFHESLRDFIRQGVSYKCSTTGAEGTTHGNPQVPATYRFPTEARYVPKLLLKAREVCPQYKGGKDRLAKIYLDPVPRLVTYYKEEKRYPDQVYQQALAFLTTKQAAELKARVGAP